MKIIEVFPEPLKFSVFSMNCLANEFAGSFNSIDPYAISWDGPNGRRQRILNKIKEYNADILCLQEVTHCELFDEGLRQLGYNMKSFPKFVIPLAHGMRQPKDYPQYQTYICYKPSRFSFTDLNLVIAKKENDSVHRYFALVAFFRLQYETQYPIAVTSFHLKSKPGFEDDRVTEVKKILKAVLESARFDPENTCYIFAGDANDVPNSECVKLFREKFNSVYHQIGDSEDLITTKKEKNGETISRMIDYIFYSDHCHPTRRIRLPSKLNNLLPSMENPSDHLCLWAEFELHPKNNKK